MNKQKVFGMIAIFSFFLNLILLGGLSVMQYNWDFNEKVITSKDASLDLCINLIDYYETKTELVEERLWNIQVECAEDFNKFSEEKTNEQIELILTCSDIKSECESLGGCS